MEQYAFNVITTSTKRSMKVKAYPSQLSFSHTCSPPLLFFLLLPLLFLSSLPLCWYQQLTPSLLALIIQIR
jgi:hypothetical protein